MTVFTNIKVKYHKRKGYEKVSLKTNGGIFCENKNNELYKITAVLEKYNFTQS